MIQRFDGFSIIPVLTLFPHSPAQVSVLQEPRFRGLENHWREMVNRKRAAFPFTLWCLSLGIVHSSYNSSSITLGHCFEVHFPSFLWEERTLSMTVHLPVPSLHTVVQTFCNSTCEGSPVTSCSLLRFSHHSLPASCCLWSFCSLSYPGDFSCSRTGPFPGTEALWIGLTVHSAG